MSLFGAFGTKQKILLWQLTRLCYYRLCGLITHSGLSENGNDYHVILSSCRLPGIAQSREISFVLGAVVLQQYGLDIRVITCSRMNESCIEQKERKQCELTSMLPENGYSRLRSPIFLSDTAIRWLSGSQ